MSADREEQLVLSGREANRGCLLFTPSLEEPHTGSYAEKLRVNLVRKFHRVQYSIVLR